MRQSSVTPVTHRKSVTQPGIEARPLSSSVPCFNHNPATSFPSQISTTPSLGCISSSFQMSKHVNCRNLGFWSSVTFINLSQLNHPRNSAKLVLNEAPNDLLVALKGFLQKWISDGLTDQFVPEPLIPVFSFACQLSVMCNLGPFNQSGTGTATPYPTREEPGSPGEEVTSSKVKSEKNWGETEGQEKPHYN